MPVSKRNSVGAALLAATLCAAFFLVTAPALAQVYRWVDEDGRVHYSDKAPPDVEAEALDIESKPTDLEATLRRLVETERRLELVDEEHADEREYQEELAAHRAEVERACRQARERLARIEPAQRLVRRDDEGDIVREYTVEERLAAVEEARQQVAEWCR